MAFQNLIVSNLVKTSSSTSNIWGFIHPLHKIWKCAQRNLKKKLRKILVPGRKIVFLQLYIWGWVHLTTDCSIVSIYSLYSFGSIECGENFIIILYSPTQIIFSNFTSGVEFTWLLIVPSPSMSNSVKASLDSNHQCLCCNFHFPLWSKVKCVARRCIGSIFFKNMPRGQLIAASVAKWSFVRDTGQQLETGFVGFAQEKM